VSLFTLGEFTLHSGRTSNYKIDCDFLTDDDIATAAALLAERVPPFRSVIGIPRGGLRLAAALGPYVSDEGVILLADDVFTTGGSLTTERRNHWDSTHGAVIFSRALTPDWVTSLFSLCPVPKPRR
jgi:orotate phosphoribosyltransferase